MHDLIGRTLGKYQILQHLGRGGMAEVYKAFQPSLDRYVAIKVLHPFMAEDKDFLARFRREAKNVAALRHPNIVQVFDFDVQDGLYYMVMEFLDGPTLKSGLEALHQRGERLPLPEALRITRDVGSALAYAHGQGIVHRDVKPANVLLERSGRVILTDFGVAKILSGTQFTATGTVLGTPAYMAPEQGMGQPGDGRSDIYSLGVMLYEMATGRLPFDADTPLAVVMKHVHEPLPLPKAVAPDLPESVERVILKALAKEPSQRYAKVAEMVEALQPGTMSAPPATSPAPKPSSLPHEPPLAAAPAGPAPSRSRSAVALAAGGGLGLLLCIGVAAAVGLALVGRQFLAAPLQVATATSLSTETPRPTRTPQPTRTRMPDETAIPSLDYLASDVIFQDDFSDRGSGWDSVSNGGGSTGYVDGTYRILVDKPQSDTSAHPGLTFVDVRVEVDAFKAGGSDDNDFGVICRYQDAENFYAFLISSDGFYGIVKFADGEYDLMDLDALQQSDFIRQGATTNHVRADCVGTNLKLYVNGHLVQEAEDQDYSEGDVGLIAGTFELPGTDIRFDNFVVIAP